MKKIGDRPMFTHHDLVIFIIAMMATITCAMEIDNNDIPMTSPSNLTQILNRMALVEDYMEMDDESPMDVEEKDHMEVEMSKTFHLNLFSFSWYSHTHNS